MRILELFSSKAKRGIYYSLGFLALILLSLNSLNVLAQEQRKSIVLQGDLDLKGREIYGWDYLEPLDVVIKPGARVTTTSPPMGFFNTVPILVLLNGNSTVLNEGTLNTSGYLADAINMRNSNNHAINRGAIISKNNTNGTAVIFYGDNNTFINEGTIETDGGAFGITGSGNNNHLVIRGSVVIQEPAPGEREDITAVNLGGVRSLIQIRDKKLGLQSDGNYADIYGHVASLGRWGQSLSIWQGSNQYFNIHEGAILLGYITNHASHNVRYPINGFVADGENNGLNIDQGAGMSYVYQYIGKWNYINDLDGRPSVKGNEVYGSIMPAYNEYMEVYQETPSGDIMAAGIGSLEIEDEGQFARVIMTNNALLNRDYQSKNARRRLRNRHSNALKGRFQPWAQSSYAGSGRDADPSDPTILGYEEKKHSITAGLPVRILNKNLDFLVNVGQGDVSIEDGKNTMTSIDARVGVYLPRFFKFRVGRHKVELSGKTLVGYTQRKTQRDVLTNVNTTPGIVKYEGTSNVFDVQVGASAETEIRLGSRTSASFRLGLDIAYDLITAYSEKENGQWFSSEYADKVSFDWETRHLVQGIVTASTGAQYRAARRLNVYGVASVTARQVLMGKEAKYTLGGVGVSFDGGNSAGFSGQLDFGATYGLTRKIKIGASAQTRASSDGVTGYAAGAFLDWRFGR